MKHLQCLPGAAWFEEAVSCVCVVSLPEKSIQIPKTEEPDMKKDTGVKSARRRQSKNLIALPFSLFCCVWLPSAASAQTYTVLHDFALSDGAGPPAGLVLSGDALYGVAWVGAVAGRGSVYKMCTDGSGYALLKEFTIAEGGLPESGLAAAAPALADCPGAVNHQPS